MEAPRSHKVRGSITKDRRAQSYGLIPMYSQGDVPISLLQRVLASLRVLWEAALSVWYPDLCWAEKRHISTLVEYSPKCIYFSTVWKLHVDTACVNWYEEPTLIDTLSIWYMINCRLGYAFTYVQREAWGRYQGAILFHSLPYSLLLNLESLKKTKLAARKPPASLPNTELGL